MDPALIERKLESLDDLRGFARAVAGRVDQ